MKAIAKTRIGLENIGIEVIKETIKKEAKILEPGVLTFTTSKADLNKLIKSPKCFTHIYELIDIKNKINKIKKIDFSKIKEPFRTICRKKKGGDLTSVDIEQEIGQFIYTKYKKSVDLKNPKERILIEIIGDNYYVGKDNYGRLSKRGYRIKTNTTSIPGDIAYSLLRIAKWKPSEKLLDPFCQTGEIVIEAALNKGKKIYAFDYNPYQIKKANFNATVAEIEDKINFLESLKLKADKIVTFLPKPNKFSKPKLIKERYREVFSKAKCPITVVYNYLLESIPEEYGYKEINAVNILSGEHKYKIVTFKK